MRATDRNGAAMVAAPLGYSIHHCRVVAKSMEVSAEDDLWQKYQKSIR